MNDPLLAPLNTNPQRAGEYIEEEDEEMSAQDPMYWLRRLAEQASGGGGTVPHTVGPRII